LDGHTIFEFLTVHVDNLFDTVERLDKKYKIVTGGIDRYPYTPTANSLREQTEGRILPFAYAATGPMYTEVKDKVTNEPDHIKVNRTGILDLVASSVRDGKANYHGYAHQEEIIREHLRDMYRDEEPEKPAKWVKLTGTDHYFHSLAFYRASIEAKAMLEALLQGEERSECGWSMIANKTVDIDVLIGKKSKSNLVEPRLF
jgi:hypothetical protein